MQVRDTGLGFGVVTIILHWIGAALVIGYVTLDLLVSVTSDAGLSRIHISLGLVVFLLFTFRLFWRLNHYHPLPIGAVSPIEVIFSRGVALGLLLAGVLLPPIEWIMVWSAGGVVTFFDLFALPPLVGQDPAIARIANVLHWLGTYAFALGITLHVLAALKHHFVLKNDTLKRMLGKHVEL